MKKVFALVLALMLLMLAMAGCGKNDESTGPLDQAPDFFVHDEQGTMFRLSAFRGKPVVLNFWASWCEPCKAEMSGFQKAYEEYGDEIQFVILNVTDGEQETVESAMKFINKEGFTFPVYFDTSYTASLMYGISSLPTTFFINEEGYIVARAAGMLSADQLQEGIDMLLP